MEPDRELHARVLGMIRDAAAGADPESPHGRFLRAFQEPMEAFLEASVRLQDSNDRLMAQVAELQAELEHKRRLAALGEMAAGVAHEIRNPLGGIELYAGLLARELGDREDLRRMAHQIQEGARRLNGLVEELLTYTGEMRPRRMRCRVADLVDSAMRFVVPEPTQGPCLVAALDLPSPEFAVDVDPDLFVRVLVNLLENARDAMGGAGTVTVVARAEGPAVLLSVLDQGPGIPAELQERIFNPFFTTRELGVGLGLAIVQRIVEAHGGEVRTVNLEGGGACFYILLPDALPRAAGE